MNRMPGVIRKFWITWESGDAQAYMSRFYPELKREIRESWKRLFDPSIILGNDMEYGTIWEIRREWVTGVTE